MIRMSPVLGVTRWKYLGNTQSTPSAVSEQSNVSAEQEVEHRQGWLDNDLKNSNNFLDDDDVDDLGKTQTKNIPPST